VQEFVEKHANFRFGSRRQSVGRHSLGIFELHINPRGKKVKPRSRWLIDSFLEQIICKALTIGAKKKCDCRIDYLCFEEKCLF
jgi:hypothetical protein